MMATVLDAKMDLLPVSGIILPEFNQDNKNNGKQNQPEEKSHEIDDDKSSNENESQESINDSLHMFISPDVISEAKNKLLLNCSVNEPNLNHLLKEKYCDDNEHDSHQSTTSKVDVDREISISNSVKISNSNQHLLSDKFMKKRQKLHDHKLFQKFKNNLFNFPSSNNQSCDSTDTGNKSKDDVHVDNVEENQLPECNDHMNPSEVSPKDLVKFLPSELSDPDFAKYVPSDIIPMIYSSRLIVKDEESKGEPDDLLCDLTNSNNPKTVIVDTKTNKPIEFKESNNQNFDNALKHVIAQGIKSMKSPEPFIPRDMPSRSTVGYAARAKNLNSLDTEAPSLSRQMDVIIGSSAGVVNDPVGESMLMNLEDEPSTPEKNDMKVMDIPIMIDGKIFHSCGICNKQFKTPKELRIHFRTHTNEKPFACDICGKAFRQRAHLKSHDKIHNGEKPYSCELCGTCFTENSSLKRHLRNHFGIKPYKCEGCEEAFITSTALKAHVKRRHEVKIIETFTCPLCPKVYSCKESLRKHVRSHDPETRISCSTCNQVCLTYGHLKKHQHTHKGIESEAIPTKEKPFECGVCQKRYTTKPHLEHHLLIHGDLSPFKCSHCETSFKSKNLLRSHIMLNHVKRVKLDKPYKCTECERRFRLPRFLDLHMGYSHSGTCETFTCDVCSKTYTRKEALARHMLTHKSENKIECEICKSVHYSQKGLKQHMKRQHTDDSDKKHVCEECGKSFRRRYSLNIHISLKHTSDNNTISCPECFTTFARKSSLNRHLKKNCGALKLLPKEVDGPVDSEPSTSHAVIQKPLMAGTSRKRKASARDNKDEDAVEGGGRGEGSEGWKRKLSNTNYLDVHMDTNYKDQIIDDAMKELTSKDNDGIGQMLNGSFGSLDDGLSDEHLDVSDSEIEELLDKSDSDTDESDLEPELLGQPLSLPCQKQNDITDSIMTVKLPSLKMTISTNRVAGSTVSHISSTLKEDLNDNEDDSADDDDFSCGGDDTDDYYGDMADQDAY